VGVDEAGQQSPALQIDDFGVRSRGEDRARAHGGDAVSLDNQHVGQPAGLHGEQPATDEGERSHDGTIRAS